MKGIRLRIHIKCVFSYKTFQQKDKQLKNVYIKIVMITLQTCSHFSLHINGNIIVSYLAHVHICILN